MRKCFHLKEKEICASDKFIISSSANRAFALAADAILGVIECPAEGIVPAEEILPHIAQVEGVMILADGMTFIFDIDRILSLGEEVALGDQLMALGCLSADVGGECQERGNEG
jgi:chemotaxis signal transduction protein